MQDENIDARLANGTRHSGKRGEENAVGFGLILVAFVGPRTAGGLRDGQNVSLHPHSLEAFEGTEVC